MLREYRGHQVDVNEEGFLVDSSQWTPEVAEDIAHEVGIAPLTPPPAINAASATNHLFIRCTSAATL